MIEYILVCFKCTIEVICVQNIVYFVLHAKYLHQWSIKLLLALLLKTTSIFMYTYCQIYIHSYV